VKTITFYSYKGGTGRTLAVANVAWYLSMFRQRVFAVDLDLEAPGLHYKLTLTQPTKAAEIQQGVVDIIYSFVTGSGAASSPLGGYVVELSRPSDSYGPIWLMPAGRVPSGEYWHRLAQINWHDLFYTENAPGVGLFLELKARIENEFKPDFLLIDARTGITEHGGIATTLLPDQVVCLLLKNRENLEGAREVLRSVKRASRLKDQAPIEIHAVLARIPPRGAAGSDEQILAEVQEYLNEPAPDLASTLAVPEVLVFHSDRALELFEALRVGEVESAEGSALRHDYLRLFARLIPRSLVEQRIRPLIEDAGRKVLDDPDRTQSELETFATYYGHPDIFRPLLQLYLLRQAEPDRLLGVAKQYLETSGEANDPLLWRVVKTSVERWAAGEARKADLGFIETVWRASGTADAAIAVRLASAYRAADDQYRALAVLEHATRAKDFADSAVVVPYLDALVAARDWGHASGVVSLALPRLGDNGDFLAAWARLLLIKGDPSEIQVFLEDPQRVANLRGRAPLSFVDLLLATERRQEAVDEATRLLPPLLGKGPSAELERLARVFRRLGLWGHFENGVRGAFEREEAERVLRYVSMEGGARMWGRAFRAR